jgi:hypothetical protein
MALEPAVGEVDVPCGDERGELASLSCRIRWDSSPGCVDQCQRNRDGTVCKLLAVTYVVSTHVMHAQQIHSLPPWYNRRRMATRLREVTYVPIRCAAHHCSGYFKRRDCPCSCLRVQRRSSDEGPLCMAFACARDRSNVRTRHYWPCMRLVAQSNSQHACPPRRSSVLGQFDDPIVFSVSANTQHRQAIKQGPPIACVVGCMTKTCTLKRPKRTSTVLHPKIGVVGAWGVHF